MERSLDYHTRVIRGDKKRLLDTDCPFSTDTCSFSFLILRIWQSYLEGNTKICKTPESTYSLKRYGRVASSREEVQLLQMKA